MNFNNRRKRLCRLCLLLLAILFTAPIPGYAAESEIGELIADAESGDMLAKELLANRLRSGDGVRKDFAYAAELLLELMKHWNAKATEAQQELQRVIASGASERDRTIAGHYPRMARSMEASFAFELGELYMKGGHGIGLDISRAAYFYCRAESQGYDLAGMRLNTLRADLPTINVFCNAYDDEYGEPVR